VSAHVVPKAKPYPEGDGDEEEEKTTIESGWEDEASTTVEQGEVAEKIRALGSEQSPITPQPRQQATGITSTGANPMLDEPTVDDQNANSQIAAIAPGLVARLVITQGNDVGQEVEIRPGKSYTIGRAIDNDVVLTDIAVSRKHFDLRFQDGAWVIVDRGSGNGTVVNGNIEDNPFMLASGDSIEIGNTVFRFDQPNTAGRPMNTFDLDMDEELSTVAGKPMRNDLPEPEPAGREREREAMYARPKTLPPPTPIRPRSPSTFPAQPQMMAPLVQPASTMPLPQMSGRAPLASQPQVPTLLASEPHSAPMGIPSTFPGQAPPQRPLMAGYPQYSELPPGGNLGPLMISPNGQRNDASTAHVSPTPYPMGGMMAPPAAARAMPSGQLSSRTKMILGAVGLALLAGVTTIAVVSSGGSKSRAAAPGPGSAVAKGSAMAPQVTPVPAPAPAPVQEPPKQDTPKQVVVVPPPTQEPPKQETPKEVVVVPPPKQDTPKKDPPRETPKQIVKKDPPRETPKQIVKRDPPRETPRETPRKDPPKRVATVDTGEARTKADALYRAKRFTEAATLLSSAAKGADESEAKELRHIADLYVKVGRGLGTGTAPAAKPTDAFPTLRQTANFDRAAGGAFSGELEAAMGRVAPKAAASYLADKNYEQARLAVIEAEKLGANTTIYKQALERAAADMYTQASKEASSDAASAKDKCQRILNFADPKSPWYQKAAKLKGSL